MRRFASVIFLILLICATLSCGAAQAADSIDLTRATVVIRGGDLPAAEKIAPVILTEEMAKRTGVRWSVTDRWPKGKQAVIALSTKSAPPSWQEHIPATSDAVEGKPEGFSIRVLRADGAGPDRVFITGNDPRGVMFGVGKLLRTLEWGTGPITLPADFAIDLAPDRPIRGHQVGYRATANSWDAWTVEQYDQYFRDMIIFGANSVENIPFEGKTSPVMKYTRPEMNLKFAELCVKYDLDHWIWLPVDFLLPNARKETEFFQEQETFYKACPRLDAVFIPGGDPGDNPMNKLLPYVERMAALLQKYHPQAKIWISLQRPQPGDPDAFFSYLETKRPTWFGGAVMGPSGPSMELYRHRLPKQYKLRWYPDITHIVRCQYEVPWLDPAWGVTIGREPVSPRPVDFAAIYHNDYRFTDGFVSYSDGIHDDFNKNLWTQLGWEPDRPVRQIAVEYARFFFRPDVAQTGADAILGLESNLRGSMAANGSVEGTLRQWQQLEQNLQGTPANWRFDMHLFRAYYDGYTRQRQLYETELEKLALKKLGEAEHIGVAPALSEAREILERTTTRHPKPDWLKRTESLAALLFHKIGYQTSVPKYFGSGSERGCVMDFINYPLNDRWWLEDQFDRIEKMTDRSAQLKQIDVIRNWENPGEGGYYDVLGDVGRSPHMLKLFNAGDAMLHYRDMPMPTQRSMGDKRRGVRFAWHKYLSRVPLGLTYTALDPKSTYTVKLFSQRPTALLVDGKPAPLIHKGETYDQVTEQEFSVPPETVKDGRIVLNWVIPDERHLNWRQQHYVTDIWVIRHGGKAK